MTYRLMESTTLHQFYLFNRTWAGVGQKMIPFTSILNIYDIAREINAALCTSYSDNLLDIPDDSVW